METTEIWENVSIEDIPGEEWRDVVGYEGKYQVSNMGRIKSLNYNHTGKAQIMKQNKVKGYLKVSLWKNGEEDWPLVHRLVATAFIPNPEGKPEVDHINGKKTDCRACNLRWVSSIENKNNGQSKKVLCVETGIVYISAREAERQTGTNNGNIIKCCKGKYKTTGGYHWQYADLLPKDSDRDTIG